VLGLSRCCRSPRPRGLDPVASWHRSGAHEAVCFRLATSVADACRTESEGNQMGTRPAETSLESGAEIAPEKWPNAAASCAAETGRDWERRIIIRLS
jgi:hypothetical protein